VPPPAMSAPTNGRIINTNAISMNAIARPVGFYHATSANHTINESCSLGSIATAEFVGALWGICADTW
jgi:hypothetical protein